MAVEQLQKFTNNATTTVPGTTSNVTTTITVATGTGALFPTLAGSQFFIATLVNTIALDPGFGQMEIIKVTARSGDVMTVVRGQEGTSGTNFPSGVLFELRPTAQAFDNIYTEVLELKTEVDLKAPLASPVFTGNPTAPTPSTGDNDTSLATTGFVNQFRRLINYEVFTASGTWTKPAGCTAVFVEVLGGGGGGGGAPATSGTQMSVGSGGGAGGYAREWITAGLGATETVTVGAGGAGGVGVGGGTGGQSSFGSHVSANGGAGGFPVGPSGGVLFITGGPGGSSAGGTAGNNYIGSPGGVGGADITTQTASSGNGGNSYFSGGGVNVSANNNGNGASSNTGAGGGGAANGTSQGTRTGGAGGSGGVMVYSYT